MKRLKWHDVELNRMAAQQTLEAIQDLRPTDFIKAGLDQTGGFVDGGCGDDRGSRPQGHLGRVVSLRGG